MRKQDMLKDDRELRQDEFERADLYMGETGTSVSLTSFMTAVDVFFIGILLTGAPQLQIRLRIPLLFLFISFLGFLYSTLIYANASGEVARLRHRQFQKQMAVGNIVSEFLGVYCLVFAIPITVLAYSTDRFLSILLLFINVIGFLLYHVWGYSILERYIRGKTMLVMISLLTGLHFMSFYAFYIERMRLYYLLSYLLLAGIIGLFTFAMHKREEK